MTTRMLKVNDGAWIRHATLNLHTGGNIYNDLLELDTGELLEITEGTVRIYKSIADYEDGNPYAEIMRN